MKKCVWLWIAALLMLCGCAGEQAVPTETTAPAVVETVPESTAQTIDIQLEAEALAEAPEPAVPVVLEAEASGEREQRCDEAVVDYSHMEDGYVMVRFTGETEKRLKVQVKGPNTTYTYNITPEEWTVLPLSDGDGSYQVGIYKNVSGTKYATVLSAKMDVTLRDEFAPFLRPNQYVNYAGAENTVAKGAELTMGIEDPLEKVAAVYDSVVAAFRYDHEKAETVKSGYIPDLDQVLAEEGKTQLEEVLRRTAAACYAAEGVYPPSVDYMCSHYGLQYDEERYIVRYELFASNLMPDITVLERSK